VMPFSRRRARRRWARDGGVVSFMPAEATGAALAPSRVNLSQADRACWSCRGNLGVEPGLEIVEHPREAGRDEQLALILRGVVVAIGDRLEVPAAKLEPRGAAIGAALQLADRGQQPGPVGPQLTSLLAHAELEGEPVDPLDPGQQPAIADRRGHAELAVDV